MIVIFDKYTDNVEKTQVTMRTMNFDARIAVLEDIGFLPDGVLSPYDYFVYGQNREDLKERELYYNFLEVPEYWEIRSVGMQGAVYDMGCKKADIYLTEQKSVQRVEWCMENGWIYRIDYYNKYALKYASEFLDMAGNVESKVYYSAVNQEMIVEQPQNDTITLFKDGKIKAFFSSYAEFLECFLEEVDSEQKRVLFIQSEEGFRLLDLKTGGGSLWEYVLFSDNNLLDKYIGMGGKNGRRFYTIPEEYPVNSAKGEALVLTSSDQLEEIEYLTQELGEVTFHIAASTQVSNKLYQLGERPNVMVYPQVSMQDLKALWEKCDFYLDINHYWETHNAIEEAHRKNVLILGFENTLHHRELLAESCIFAGTDAEGLARTMKELVNHAELVQERLARQQGRKCELLEDLRGIV